MRYEFENGDYAILTGGDFWATLTTYNKDGEALEKRISENVLALLDYLRDKVQESRKETE